MMYRTTGRVEQIVAERPGVQEIAVRVADSDEIRRVLVLTQLTGRVEIGEVVPLNTVAVELGLGTGGYDFVVSAANFDAEPPGHLLKLRYTPLQTPVLAVEAPESPHHETLKNFTSLNSLPVVAIELHSQLPAVCAAAHWAWERLNSGQKPRLVYIMTDGAALPMAFSRLMAELRERELLSATITAGQAFGGEYEAINLYSALAAAKDVAAADIVIAGQGPGNAGTGTPLGFSGIDAGSALNATASLGGTPIFAPRLSFAEQRTRHYGLSEHTRTILMTVALTRALVPIPRLPSAQYEEIWQALCMAGIPEKHSVISVDAEAGLAALEATGLRVTTMGRDMAEERAYFLAGAAAGIVTAQYALTLTETE